MINKFLLKRLQLWLAIFSTRPQCNITNLRKSRWSTSHDNVSFPMIYLWFYIFLFSNALMPISAIIVYCLEYNDNMFYRMNLPSRLNSIREYKLYHNIFCQQLCLTIIVITIFEIENKKTVIWWKWQLWIINTSDSHVM